VRNKQKGPARQNGHAEFRSTTQVQSWRRLAGSHLAIEVSLFMPWLGCEVNHLIICSDKDECISEPRKRYAFLRTSVESQ
jgi:hypothetical protein